jgi:hypothetical protein
MEIVLMSQWQTAPGPQTAVPAVDEHFDSYDIAMDAQEFEMLVRRMETIQRSQVSELERMSGIGIERRELLQVWKYLSGLNASLLVELNAMCDRYNARMHLTTVALDQYHERRQQDLDSAT